MSAAGRNKRKRWREKNGRMVLQDMEVDGVDHVEMLIAGGFLERSQSENGAAIRDASVQVFLSYRTVVLRW